MAPKQTEVNKNKILTWLQEDKIDHDEIDVSKTPLFEWQIQNKDNKLTIYTPASHPDRVIIQTAISFSEEQQKLLNEQWEKARLSTLILNITSSLTNFNVRYSIIQKEGKITGIRIFLFFIDNLNKYSLLNGISRLGEVLMVTLNQLSSVIGVELQQLKAQQEASDVNPLAT